MAAKALAVSPQLREALAALGATRPLLEAAAPLRAPLTYRFPALAAPADLLKAGVR